MKNSKGIPVLKRTTKILSEDEDIYKSIFDSALEGIVICNPGGIILSANTAAATFLGYDSPLQLVGIASHDLCADIKQRKAMKSAVIHNGYVKEMEIRLKKKDGNTIDVLGNTILKKKPQRRAITIRIRLDGYNKA